MEGELKIHDQEGDEFRVPVETWDRRVWACEVERESGGLNVLP